MNIIEISLKICGDNGNKSNKKMVKQGCWDIPRLCVGCYGFYVVVQCFFPAFDVLCGGDCGTILPRTFTSLLGLRWGGELLLLLGFMFVFGLVIRSWYTLLILIQIFWINFILSKFLFHPTTIQSLSFVNMVVHFLCLVVWLLLPTDL